MANSHYQNNIKRRERSTAFVLRVKKFGCCIICGEKRPWVLDFHHVFRMDDNQKISRMVVNGTSIKTIKKEIRKCVMVCSNCHRDIHHRILQHKKND